MTSVGIIVASAASILGLAGCATPGPLHVYSVSAPQAAEISDFGGKSGKVSVPSFLEGEDVATGMAYDPFTDHFFVRLEPGNRFLVVDRPARAVKRRFTVAEIPVNGGGDLAIRPATGHVFLLRPGRAELDEINRYGEWIRVVKLEAAPTRAATGIAYDMARDRLLVLFGENEIVAYSREGGNLGKVCQLEKAVGHSLGYDAEQRELYAPLAAPERRIGVFSQDGKLQRTLEPQAFGVDVGPRSFLRMF
jgi:hypothetical protein